LATVFSAALVFTIPAILFFLIMQRQIISGLTSGSVKG
jgi:multiple sugar transport system permease protein